MSLLLFLRNTVQHYAKLRCGVAPIKIETCRYGINRIPVNERLCESCESVEDEYHVLMQCPKYDDIRTVAFESICRITNSKLLTL